MVAPGEMKDKGSVGCEIFEAATQNITVKQNLAGLEEIKWMAIAENLVDGFAIFQNILEK